ncbi:pseudouridine synthase [Comamonas odontotermitis]|uniref:pseudouridine synthase n=1 Tax=Comamonas odontotermitis TaxID=379895 RepID=UPI003752F679
MLIPVYEDAHLVVLNKPSGLLCVPGRGPDKLDCLSSRAQAQWPDALVVHRLDQATSGLVVMARSPAVQRALGDAFAARRVDKRYIAVASGSPVAQPAPADAALLAGMPQDAERWSLIDLPLIADWERRPLQRVDHAVGKPSQTWWRAVTDQEAAALPSTPSGSTRLWLAPVTGRTHQLRVHLQAIGHPILGDSLYATSGVQAMAPRLLLQAQHIAFTHPVTQVPVACTLPADF